MNQNHNKNNTRSIIVAAIVMAAVSFVGVMAVRVYNGIQDKYAYRDSGIALYESGEYAAAAIDLQNSLDEPAILAEPVDRDTRLYLADAYFLAKDYTHAIEQYDVLLQTEVEQIPYLTLQRTISQGMIDFKERKFEKALPAFQAGVDAGHTECAYYAGVCAVELGKEDEAIAYLTTYLSYQPDCAYACIQLADYYLTREHPDACLEYIEQAKTCSDQSYAEQLALVEYEYYFALKDYNKAYDLLCAYRDAYDLTEELQKEYDFLYTRQTTHEITDTGA